MPHPAGSPRYARAAPPYTHSPKEPHQPPLTVHLQSACLVYYLREPRYGCPSPPPPHLPVPVVRPSYQRNLELAYLQGHVARLDRRSENPASPQRACSTNASSATRPHSRRGWLEGAGALGSAATCGQAPRRAPSRGACRGDGATPGTDPAGIPLPPRGPGGRHRGRDYDRQGKEHRAACRRSYRPPERYAEPQSKRRASDGLPPPLEISTLTSLGATTSRAVAHLTPPPRGGRTGGGTTPIGAYVGIPAQIQPNACAMARLTQRASQNRSPQRFPEPAICI